MEAMMACFAEGPKPEEVQNMFMSMGALAASYVVGFAGIVSQPRCSGLLWRWQAPQAFFFTTSIHG